MASNNVPNSPVLRVAIVGLGPAGLTLALALSARPDVSVKVFEAAAAHDLAPTYNPDRSYTIDITGHGINAVNYVGATAAFDDELILFKGIFATFVPSFFKGAPRRTPCKGWTGSRGDICRVMYKELRRRMSGPSAGGRR